MSISAINWAFSVPGLKPGQKLVLITLANYADEDGLCHPGVEKIAEMASMSVRAVVDNLSILEQMGLLTKRARGVFGQGRKSNIYSLSINADSAHMDTISADSAPPISADSATDTVVVVNPPIVPPLPLTDGTDFVADSEYIESLRHAYPKADIKSEFAKMRAWCLSNPTKLKTRRGIKRFINSWVARNEKPDRPSESRSRQKSRNDIHRDYYRQAAERAASEEMDTSPFREAEDSLWRPVDGKDRGERGGHRSPYAGMGAVACGSDGGADRFRTPGVVIGLASECIPVSDGVQSLDSAEKSSGLYGVAETNVRPFRRKGRFE